ncbi:hypothetical protein D3C71_1324780 [compost metagenome]
MRLDQREQQAQQCCLALAGGSDQGDQLAGLDAQRDIGQNRLAWLIAIGDMIQPQSGNPVRRHGRNGPLVLRSQLLEDDQTLGRGHHGDQDREGACQPLQRPLNLPHQLEEGGEHAEAGRSGGDAVGSPDEGEKEPEPVAGTHRQIGGDVEAGALQYPEQPVLLGAPDFLQAVVFMLKGFDDQKVLDALMQQRTVTALRSLDLMLHLLQLPSDEPADHHRDGTEQEGEERQRFVKIQKGQKRRGELDDKREYAGERGDQPVGYAGNVAGEMGQQIAAVVPSHRFPFRLVQTVHEVPLKIVVHSLLQLNGPQGEEGGQHELGDHDQGKRDGVHCALLQAVIHRMIDDLLGDDGLGSAAQRQNDVQQNDDGERAPLSLHAQFKPGYHFGIEEGLQLVHPGRLRSVNEYKNKAVFRGEPA